MSVGVCRSKIYPLVSIRWIRSRACTHAGCMLPARTASPHASCAQYKPLRSGEQLLPQRGEASNGWVGIPPMAIKVSQRYLAVLLCRVGVNFSARNIASHCRTLSQYFPSHCRTLAAFNGSFNGSFNGFYNGLFSAPLSG
jgi:hypothetical protein